MSKLVNIYAKVDPKLKEQVEAILSKLGISISTAIEMFFRQIVLNKKLPFEIKLSYEKPICVDDISKDELDAELEKRYKEYLLVKARPANEVFEEITNEIKQWELKSK